MDDDLEERNSEILPLVSSPRLSHSNGNYSLLPLQRELSSRLEQYRIIPDVLSHSWYQPQSDQSYCSNFDNLQLLYTLKITFSYANNLIFISNGDALNPPAIKNKPNIMIEKQNGIKEETLEMPSNNELNRIYFTILCVDPDVPHGFAQIVHYLKVNIPKVGDKILQQGDEITKWVTPAPTINSGQHRYVFFLFKQSEFLQPSKVKETVPLFNFSTVKFIDTHGLQGPLDFTLLFSEYDGSLYPVLSSTLTCSYCCCIQ